MSATGAVQTNTGGPNRVKIDLLSLLRVILAIPLAATAVAAQPDVSGALAKIQSTKVEERRQAMQEFASSLGTTKVKDYGNEVLPVIVKGTSDPDEEVRRWAFGALNLLGHVKIWAKLSKDGRVYGKTVSIDLETEPKLKENILAAVNDPSPEIREYAIAAISLGYPPSKDTEKLLLRKLQVEKEKRIRRAVVAGLGAGKYTSKEAVGALLGVLDDSSAELRGGAAEFLAEMNVQEALPKLAQGLQSDDAYIRQEYARAFAKYGPSAAKYLADVERAEAKEKDRTVKGNMQSAIRKMKGQDKEKVK